MSEDILKRLEVLEAKDEIRELVSNYAESCDRQDLEALEKYLPLMLHLIPLMVHCKAKDVKIY